MKHILVIDDEAPVRFLLEKMLEREGFAVKTASDGEEGMQLFSKMSFDLVITDIIMPEREGIEIIMEMRKNNPSVPVIAISGGGFNSPQDYLSIACAAGAKAVLEKPVERAVLLSAVKTILEAEQGE